MVFSQQLKGPTNKGFAPIHVTALHAATLEHACAHCVAVTALTPVMSSTRAPSGGALAGRYSALGKDLYAGDNAESSLATGTLSRLPGGACGPGAAWGASVNPAKFALLVS
jgi:hypothetical protein